MTDFLPEDEDEEEVAEACLLLPRTFAPPVGPERRVLPVLYDEEGRGESRGLRVFPLALLWTPEPSLPCC